MPDSRLESVQRFLTLEAEYVDEQRWDEWLELFADDVEYWIPAWQTEHQISKDPARGVSLIYYRGKAGLEDRIFRIRTGRSSASTPMPRTCHMVTNVRVADGPDGQCAVKANFVTYSFRFKEATHFFGRYEYLLRPQGDGWKIARKTTIVLNDVIPQVLDIYSA